MDRVTRAHGARNNKLNAITYHNKNKSLITIKAMRNEFKKNDILLIIILNIFTCSPHMYKEHKSKAHIKSKDQ